VSLNIYDIEFKSDIVVLLPMLSDNASMQYHDHKSWEAFLQGLLEHEHDHVRIINDPSYRDEARTKIMAVKDLVMPYDPALNLDELIRNAVENETARIGHELILKIKKRNEDYDRLTDHGIKHDMREDFFK
jgi:predicted secreted Zn-dependent protease